jgi:hypothetical protein
MGVHLVRRALATEGAGLSGNRKLLLVTLADFARDPDPVPVAFPSFDKLRRCLGASTRTIERSTAWLVDHRYLEQTIHAGRTSWRIVVDKLAKVQQTFKFDATKCRQSVVDRPTNCRPYKEDPPVPEPPLPREAGSTVRDRVREADAESERPPSTTLVAQPERALLREWQRLYHASYGVLPPVTPGDIRKARGVVERYGLDKAVQSLTLYFADRYPGNLHHPFAVYAARPHEWIVRVGNPFGLGITAAGAQTLYSLGTWAARKTAQWRAQEGTDDRTGRSQICP